MGRLVELEFSDERRTVVTAELLEAAAPIACANVWDGLAAPYRARLHHGRHCAAELWCYLPAPDEPTPFENSTVFPATGDLLYYHFIQPPTRRGRWVCDLGLFYAPGQSRLPSGWLPGNRVARVRGGPAAIRQLELIAADLLQGREIEVVLRRAQAPASEEPATGWAAELAGWLRCWEALPDAASEADVTRLCAGAEEFAQELVEWLDGHGPGAGSAERTELRAGARRVAERAAWWRFATDAVPPVGWSEPVVAYWRAFVRRQVEDEPVPGGG